MHFDDPDLLEKKMAAEIYLELLVKSGRSSGTDVDWLVDCHRLRDREREAAKAYYEDLKGE
jgi:hypothetical protein